MIVKEKIKKESLEEPFVKAVTDIKMEIIAIGCELHTDCAEELVKDGSSYSDLWGFNIYPDGSLEFVSLINIRPADGNRSMNIQNQEIKDKISDIVKKWI